MELLKERIYKDGHVVGEDILKVDSFLNHQIDVKLMDEIGKEFYRLFKDDGINKIVTVETSGIVIACAAAKYFDVPVVFAKKHESKNLDAETYEGSVYSFTKGKYYKIRVSKKYLNKEDRVLIVDDFLASGSAVEGVLEILAAANATPVGVGIVIEKSFQEGAQLIKDKGLKLESLARIETFENGKVILKP